jgi:hypothetical protein
MNGRKMEFGSIKAMFTVEQRANHKHSAVRNHGNFDPRKTGSIFLPSIFLSLIFLQDNFAFYLMLVMASFL